MMELQNRDLKLLEHLNRYGLLTAEQVIRLCFAGINPTTCFRRLRKLENDAYIIRAEGLPQGRAAWYLGKAGAGQVGAEIAPRFTNKNSLAHDAATTDIRLALESIGLAREFTTDREIRSKMKWQNSSSGEHVIPDGILIENVDGKLSALALEVELNAKAHARYVRIFNEYVWKKNISYVWYVVASKAITKAVLTCWPKVKHYDFSPKLLITEMNELLANGTQSLMQTCGGDVKPLSGFFNLKTPTIEKEFSDQAKQEKTFETPIYPAQTVSTQDQISEDTPISKINKENPPVNEIDGSARRALPAIDHPPSTSKGGRLQYACGMDDLL